MKKERKKKDSEAGKWESKFKEMQATIQRNESIIQVLKMQLSQYQEKEEVGQFGVKVTRNLLCNVWIKHRNIIHIYILAY